MIEVSGVPVPEEALAQLCSQFKVRELSLFGSGVRGELRPDSDIDLLVEFQPDARIGLLHLLGLQRRLSEVFGREVDLVPKARLKENLRDRVLNESETLYAA